MNATVTHLLQLSPARPHRRFHVGSHVLNPAAISNFNRVLESLQTAPMDEDQIASFGRALSPVPAAAAVPPWILARMRDAAAVRLMLGDSAWELLDRAARPTRLVSAYLRDHDDLVPDRLPVLGRMDDAIVVEAAWPQIGPEVLDYLDYRRLRHVEAGLRGCGEHDFNFTRHDWEVARDAEAAWSGTWRTSAPAATCPMTAAAVDSASTDMALPTWQAASGRATDGAPVADVKPCPHLPRHLRCMGRVPPLRPPPPSQRVFAGRLDDPHPRAR